MIRCVAVVLAAMFVVPVASEAATPEVVLYGASWCGPCRTVKGFLERNRVRFTYQDIDTDQGRQAFTKATGAKRGIPLLFIGRDKIRGAQIKTIRLSLGRAGYRIGAAQPTGSEEYGGLPVEWWREQFQDLRSRVRISKRRVEVYKERAQYQEDLEEVRRMNADHEILVQSLEQLEIDASRARVKRKDRMY